MFGRLAFGEGDYVVVPRGVIHKMTFESDDNRVFFVESFGPVDWPQHFGFELSRILLPASHRHPFEELVDL
jgi:homogentisate 1,2-dioxygenase